MGVALLTALLACGGSPPPVSTPLTPQSPEALQVEAVIQAWNERTDLPALGSAEMRSLLVADAPSVEAHGRLCARPWIGCLIERRSETLAVPPLTYADGRPVSAGSRLSGIRHEAVHFAGRVSGLGDDPYHQSHVLWGYHCGQDLACREHTVEERARSIANGAP